MKTTDEKTVFVDEKVWDGVADLPRLPCRVHAGSRRAYPAGKRLPEAYAAETGRKMQGRYVCRTDDGQVNRSRKNSSKTMAEKENSGGEDMAGKGVLRFFRMVGNAGCDTCDGIAIGFFVQKNPSTFHLVVKAGTGVPGIQGGASEQAVEIADAEFRAFSVWPVFRKRLPLYASDSVFFAFTWLNAMAILCSSVPCDFHNPHGFSYWKTILEMTSRDSISRTRKCRFTVTGNTEQEREDRLRISTGKKKSAPREINRSDPEKSAQASLSGYQQLVEHWERYCL